MFPRVTEHIRWPVLTESLQVSLTQNFCSSPNDHLTSIKGQRYQQISQVQAAEERFGHWWLVTGELDFLYPRVSSYKGQPIPVSALASGEMWFMFLSLSVKTQVWGRISKNYVFVCLFLWNQEY